MLKIFRENHFTITCPGRFNNCRVPVRQLPALPGQKRALHQFHSYRKNRIALPTLNEANCLTVF